MPTHGCGLTPGCFGLTELITSRVIGAYADAASLYSGMEYVEVREPGGTFDQPICSPTSLM